jgi:maltokinase
MTAPVLAGLEPLLAAWLPTQRWFAGKGAPVQAVRVLAHTTLGETNLVEHLVVAVDQQVPGVGRRVTPYQVPLQVRREPVERLQHVLLGQTPTGFVYDALHDRSVTGRILDRLHSGEHLGDLRFHRVEGADIPVGLESLVLTGEQSNTSLAFGDQALLKVFRRLSPGPNPDIEVHAALARTDCPFVAPLLGWVEGTWADPDTGQPVTGHLAMLQTFLVTATDGWRLALTSVSDLFAERDLHADEVGGDFAGEAFRLGRATAGVHSAMAEVLPTGRWDAAERRAQADAMRGRLDDAGLEVPALAPMADGLRGAFDGLADLDDQVPVQRVHGDLHLGQVLRTSKGWKLIDFEGEPEKPVSQRTLLDSPLRDVAGMLRSFDYAALNALLGDHPDDMQLAYRAGEWAQRNRGAFLDGYASGSSVDPHAQQVLLRAYETDKAVYELLYEARNRPAWTVIPMTALERLAQQRRGGVQP